MYRLKAALKHFVLSILVFSAIVIILINFWYPSPYFMAAGGWQGLKIAAPIDLILGPLLTFIIFDKTKSKSKLIADMTVIIILQLLALAWGINTIYQQRPVANVYWGWEKSFFSVSASELKAQGYDLDKIPELSSHLPALIIARKPANVDEAKDIQNRIAQHSIPPFLQTQLYTSIEESFGEIKKANIALKDLVEEQDRIDNIYKELVAEYGGLERDYLFVPLYVKYQDLILVFKEDKTYITTLVLRDKK